MISVNSSVGWLASGLALALAVLVWWQSRELGRTVDAMAEWRQAAIAGKAAMDEMKARSEALHAALEQREEDLRAVRAGLEKQRMMLMEAIRNDKTAADWGSAPLPDAVVGILRQNGARAADSDAQAKPPAAPAVARATANTAGRKKR